MFPARRSNLDPTRFRKVQYRDRTRARHRRRRAIVVAVVLGGLLTLGMLGFARGPVRADRVTLTIDRAKVEGVSRLQLGATHTQFSADAWNDPAAVTRARGVLSTAAIVPEPAHHGLGRGQPGDVAGTVRLQQPRRARRLDAGDRRDAGDHPVLRARLDEGRPGGSDRLVASSQTAPLPSHFADFAALAAAVAKRYPRRPLLPGLERAQGLLATRGSTARTTRATPSSTTRSTTRSRRSARTPRSAAPTR